MIIIQNIHIPRIGIKELIDYEKEMVNVMKQCMDVDAITLRLKKIEGQVRGIQKMVQEDKPCEEILIQIGAVKSALHKTGQVILEGHMHHCVLDGIQRGEEEEVIEQLMSALNQFSKMI